MGSCFADQFSLLHAAVGVIAYFWGVPLWLFIVVHTIFEIGENSRPGIDFINNYVSRWWPGGKPRADSIVNTIGDTVFAIFGFAAAYLLDTEMKGRMYQCDNPPFSLF